MLIAALINVFNLRRTRDEEEDVWSCRGGAPTECCCCAEESEGHTRDHHETFGTNAKALGIPAPLKIADDGDGSDHQHHRAKADPPPRVHMDPTSSPSSQGSPRFVPPLHSSVSFALCFGL